MFEYFLVICMITATDNRVHCEDPMKQRGPFYSEQGCIKANQALGAELGLEDRGRSFIAICDARYTEETDNAPEERA